MEIAKLVLVYLTALLKKERERERNLGIRSQKKKKMNINVNIYHEKLFRITSWFILSTILLDKYIIKINEV